MTKGHKRAITKGAAAGGAVGAAFGVSLAHMAGKDYGRFSHRDTAALGVGAGLAGAAIGGTAAHKIHQHFHSSVNYHQHHVRDQIRKEYRTWDKWKHTNKHPRTTRAAQYIARGIHG